MRRFLMLLVAGLVLAGVAAPAASAVNTDFPYGDTDAADWARVGVNASSGASCDTVFCEFEAVADGGWVWKLGGSPYPTEQHSCAGAGFEGFLSSGLFGVDDAGWVSGQYPVGYFGFCYYNQPDVSAMAEGGEICAHVGTGEVWVRQAIGVIGHLNGATYGGPGTTFGRVVGDGGELSSIVFGGPGFVDTELGEVGSNDLDFKHRVEFDVTGSEGPYGVVVPEVQEESPCGWPELS